MTHLFQHVPSRGQRLEVPVKTRTVVPLTSQQCERREEILRFVESYWRIHYHSPSIRGIMAATKIASSSTVHYHLLKLAEQGRMLYQEGSHSGSMIPLFVRDLIRNYTAQLTGKNSL